jgi:putative hydrolase of the HAD superfamily
MSSAETGRGAALDAVCVDGFGTLLALDDPGESLRSALADLGVNRSIDDVRSAFRAEASYYRPRSLTGRDGPTLAALRQDCVRVFLEHLEAPLSPEAFVPAFMESIVFRLTDGADRALKTLRAAGLSLACVANWDVSLHSHLRRLGVYEQFEVVLSSAEAGAEKPDPRIFRVALDRLEVEAARALHIGDDPVDRDGAAAAGLAFEPAPLSTLPERLGL